MASAANGNIAAATPALSNPRSRQWRTALSLALLTVLCGCAPRFAPPSVSASSARGAHLTFLVPRGPIASAERTHLFEVVALLMVVVLPVLLLAPFVAWRYRFRGSTARYEPRWSFSKPLEFVIWGVPHAVVIVLAVWLWDNTVALDPYAAIASAKPPLRVEVIGYDWKWLFIYPDLKIASMGEFAFSSGRPLAIALTSDTVMQSFFIPALGSQIYAMAGMVTHLHLQANRPGSFRGLNTQYNGDGFYQQRFLARAMTPADFKAWTGVVGAKGVAMSADVYRAIARRSTVNETKTALAVTAMPKGVLYVSAVSPGLFTNVVASFKGGPTDAAAICCGRHTQAAASSAAGAVRAAKAR